MVDANCTQCGDSPATETVGDFAIHCPAVDRFVSTILSNQRTAIAGIFRDEIRATCEPPTIREIAQSIREFEERFPKSTIVTRIDAHPGIVRDLRKRLHSDPQYSPSPMIGKIAIYARDDLPPRHIAMWYADHHFEIQVMQ